MNLEQINFKALIPFVIVAIIIFIVITIISYVSRQIRTQINSALRGYNTLKQFSKAVQEVQNEEPQPKSIGGSTKIYLEKIHKDFPDFHYPDAENAIKTFVNEYIRIRYQNQNNFIKSKIDGNILLDIPQEQKAEISNIVINAVTIYDYVKTRDYATIKYKVSVGFNKNGSRIETRYEVDYTLQLYKDSIAQLSMTCPNCGGIFDKTQDSVCPYCDAPIIKDTVMSWVITATKEIG